VSAAPANAVQAYGLWFPAGSTALTIELYCFRNGRTVEQGGLGKAEHFWRVCDILWNRPDLPAPLMVRHEDAERMIEHACRERYLSVAGCSSSGKSHVFAAWGLVNWLAAPADTQVVMTSTSLQMARKRIWGSVIALWTALGDLAPGKLRDSIGQINYVNENGQVIDKAGITLVAAEQKRERDAVGKLIGMKQVRVIVIADELPELSEAVIQACFSNLSVNPVFQLIGLGNPASYFDAFGVFSEPVGGWHTINESFYEWDTARGKCIRFNAEQNENVRAGYVVHNWMITAEKMEEERERLGANSIAFWRFYKGFWAPSGATDGIYSEADIVGSGANRTTDYPGEVIPLVAIDPAFTNGGDRTMVVFGRLGVSSSGHYVLEILDSVQLNDDLTIADVPRTHQIVRQFIALCRARGIDPYNVAADATGAGSPFCDVLAEEWSDEILRIQFGGLATERAVSANDRRIGKDAFANRVTEIWAVGREFLRTNQLKGINPDIAKEMTSRRYKTVSAVKGMKLRIETKPEFKSRVGYSPDLADATFMLLDLARERHGFVAVEMPHTVDGRPKQREEASLGFRRINQSIARLNIESEMGILVDE
jgi:hypothetical protein